LPTPGKQAPSLLDMVEAEVAAQELFAVLTCDGEYQRFTFEDLLREKETMTEEEKAAALLDMFGSLCGELGRASKRLKQPEPGLVDPLIKNMRLQVDSIPNESKPALLEAMAKASTHEFRNDRLKLFLQRNNMDYKASTSLVLSL